MRKILIVSTLLAAGLVQAATTGPDHYRARTAAELAKVCSTPASQSDHATALAFCHGVLAGAYGYYVAAVPEADRFVCAPNPSPTRAQVANGFVAWLKSRPNYAADAAIDVLFRYAAETFPCKR